MSWPTETIKDRTGLMPPADPTQLDTVARRLGVQFPQDYLEFLAFADGGILPGGRLIIYSAGTGIHPSETLLAANEKRPPDFPLVLIARDAYEEFGFLKSDLAALGETDRVCPVYVFMHETETLERVAECFADFVRQSMH